MTVVIDVAFPFGYVHATPWGTHVNEGAIEWPPSPWRLLRGLVATWRTRCPELPDDVVLPILRVLAEPPEVRTAPRVESSIRAYVPNEGHRRGAAKAETDLMVDSFAAVAPGTGLAFRWSVDLDDASRRALARIVEALPYLGRAESICDASVRFEGGDGRGWRKPASDEDGAGVRTLTPTLPLDLDSLCVSIRAMRKGRRLHPPGARWIKYEVDEPVAAAGRVARRPAAVRVHAVRLVLSGPAPVSVRQTVIVAEALRSAAMSKYGGQHGGGSSEVFAGKDGDGRPLRGHRHAHWLPLDLDGDRLIDTALVWATDGFGPEEIAALGAVRRLHFHGGDGLGSAAYLDVGFEVGGTLDRLRLGSIAGASSIWRSETPFLPQRHRKAEAVEDFLEDCLHRELASRGIETQFALRLLSQTSWGSFRRHRRAERLAQARSGFGVELRFEQPIPVPGGGPLCLGLLSHFGMGRFTRDD